METLRRMQKPIVPARRQGHLLVCHDGEFEITRPLRIFCLIWRSAAAFGPGGSLSSLGETRCSGFQGASGADASETGSSYQAVSHGVAVRRRPRDFDQVTPSRSVNLDGLPPPFQG